MAVTAGMVKELRERTGAGMMDCKKALEETAGDIEGAIELMRKNGQAKAAKKAGRIAAEGTVITRVGNGYAVAIEFNCETDFVGRDASSWLSLTLLLTWLMPTSCSLLKNCLLLSWATLQLKKPALHWSLKSVKTSQSVASL